ncbi:MAG: hypothetical protein ACREDL_25345 [Bradyrhizobium sp.]
MLVDFAVFVAFAICLGFLVVTIWERIHDALWRRYLRSRPQRR